MMVLLICRECGYFRDMTSIAFSVHPEYFIAGDPAQVVKYNKTVTHCKNGHGEMYQVQKGDRLAVLPATVENEKEGKNG